MANPYLEYLAKHLSGIPLLTAPIQGPPAPAPAPAQPMTDFQAAMATRGPDLRADLERTASPLRYNARLGKVVPDLGGRTTPLTAADIPIEVFHDPTVRYPSDPGMDVSMRGWWWWMLHHPDRLADFIYRPVGGASRGGYTQGT